MSLINDALKRAKQAPPRNAPNALPPLQPVAEESSPIFVWLLLAVPVWLEVTHWGQGALVINDAYFLHQHAFRVSVCVACVGISPSVMILGVANSITELVAV